MFYIDICCFNDIDVVTVNKVFNMLNDIQKNKVLKNKKKIMSYYLLEKYIRINKLNIDIKDMKYNINGKPYFDNGFNFNISNKDDITILVTSKYIIGCDIEKIRDYNPNIVNYYFNDEEKLELLKSTNKNYTFFKIYTLKESYIKMMGLHIGYFKNCSYNKCYTKTIKYNDYCLSICLTIN